MKKKIRCRGFTLLELMTVATVLSILAAIAVPNFLNAIFRAKVARSIAEQELLAWALEMYYVDMDAYPENKTEFRSSYGDLVPLSTPVAYLSAIPQDVFLSPNDYDKKVFIQESRGGNPHYWYVNFMQPDGKRDSLIPYGLEGSANYVIYGLGPSYTMLSGPDIPHQFIEYSPSNGTRSEGLIQTFRP